MNKTMRDVNDVVQKPNNVSGVNSDSVTSMQCWQYYAEQQSPTTNFSEIQPKGLNQSLFTSGGVDSSINNWGSSFPNATIGNDNSIEISGGFKPVASNASSASADSQTPQAESTRSKTIPDLELTAFTPVPPAKAREQEQTPVPNVPNNQATRDFIRQLVGEIENPDAPPDFLRHFAGNQAPEVRRAVASNANTPTDVLAQLASRDQPQEVRMAVARNPNAPPEVLAQLASSEQSLEMRMAIASHLNAPPAALTVLASRDRSLEVRMAVARNPNAPPDVLAQLANRDQPIVLRMLVARHPNAPPDVLTQLARDRDPQDTLAVITMAVAENRNAPPAALREIASRDQPQWIRMAVARHRNAPPDVLTQLASQEQPIDVRMAVAVNDKAPPAALLVLARDLDPEVRAAARAHPNFPR